ncbi:MAG: hypothetical protein B1H13_08560 [Desulfobacteraceae bacterium 4484_190.3]|nr:MAG: hypothetical protein B1H13_08560 [Desulfobacteraceae bacterium 4484_190.3]
MEQDIIKGLGPLGGIYTALQAIPTEYGFFVACDMPFLSPACLPEVERLIRNRQYQTIRFFDRVSVRYVDEYEVRKLDPSLRSFLNINRPEDLARISHG